MLTAKFRTRCLCGRWVQPGEKIEFDCADRITVGCCACCRSAELASGGVPDPEWGGAPFTDDDWGIFHE